ncbi:MULTISPECIES: IclR family transcriptional regulator [Streptomyces]|uniref:Transcriptional regulator n=1 Tax=Streptomyces lasiicapitis TaxID=1923961 RepID=A0ABQ2LV50_9ACTN|nr:MULTISPECIES: helix-turn-helix domain-containing protein [Streptomyces]GGO43569.1 transcriptional regulator [Streptomyces lasiicapitis]
MASVDDAPAHVQPTVPPSEATSGDEPSTDATAAAVGHTAVAPTLIGSVQRAMRLLEAAASHPGGAPAKQLAREAGLALPTAYHLLRTLNHEGYLRREKGVFVLGDAAERLSTGAAEQNRRVMIGETLAHWRDVIGVPLYFAIYQDGEIEVVSVADTSGNPAVEEWADFRETGHAHAIGQCLLAQLDDEARRDHLDRHPVRSLTPNTVRDDRTLLRRLDARGRMTPVVEYQEYALGTVCAAIPITVGSTAATLAISVPSAQADRLLPAARLLQEEIGKLLRTLGFSISI